MIIVNASLYAFYLIVVKKLLAKYHPLTFIKWIYLFGFVIVLPFGWNEFLLIEWNTMPVDIWMKMLYVVVGTTFLTYLLNIFALTKLKPTTVSAFVYLQPVIASIFALLVKSDSLNAIKILGATLIFCGVYLVSKPSKQ